MLASIISNNLKAIAGIGGALFISYAIYFDYKRHRDPLFKQKLRERRKKAEESRKKASEIKFPEVLDPRSMNEFFQKCLMTAERCTSEGNVEEAAENFAYVAVLSNNAQQLLGMLRQTVPEEVLEATIKKIPEANQRLNAYMIQSKTASSSASKSIFGQLSREVEKGGDDDEEEEEMKLKLPDPPTAEATREFCLHCLAVGDEMTNLGKLDKACELYSYALALADNPQLILQLFQQSMPDELLQMVIAKLPATKDKVKQHLENVVRRRCESEESSGVLVEEDLE